MYKYQKKDTIIKPKFIKIGNSIININQIKDIHYIDSCNKLIIKYINSDDYFEINNIFLLDFLRISNELTITYITTK